MTGCAHSAAQLAGVDPKTVARYVAARAAGRDPLRAGGARLDHRPVAARSKRSWSARRPRSTRRWCTSGSRRWALWAGAHDPPSGGRRQAGVAGGSASGVSTVDHRPARGCSSTGAPATRIGGVPTILFCACPAWSGFGIVVPTWDRNSGTVLSCLDSSFRLLGGAPAFVLFDPECQGRLGAHRQAR